MCLNKIYHEKFSIAELKKKVIDKLPDEISLYEI
jgi:hypothetical protein